MNIEVKNVSFNAGGIEILKNINFSLKPSSFTAIIGPNGAGKSTLIKIMLGLLDTGKNTGKVLYDGIEVSEVNKKFGWLGYVPQNYTFDRSIPITLDEFFKITCPVKNDEKYDTVLNSLNLYKLKKYIMGGLSGGEIQRAMIAYNLFHDKRVLFLDEPTSAIDIEGETLVYSILNNLNKTYKKNIIIISHDIETVLKNVDTVICLNKTIHCIGGACDILKGDMIQNFFESHRGLYKHHERCRHYHA